MDGADVDINSRGWWLNASLYLVRNYLRYHRDAVDDGANGHTEGATWQLNIHIRGTSLSMQSNTWWNLAANMYESMVSSILIKWNSVKGHRKLIMFWMFIHKMRSKIVAWELNKECKYIWRDDSDTCTIVSDAREVCFGVKGYRLVTRVITGHIAFSAVDAHVLQLLVTSVDMHVLHVGDFSWYICVVLQLLVTSVDSHVVHVSDISWYKCSTVIGNIS